MTPPISPLVELAEDWLAAKSASSSASNPANSDRARRQDLARWGRAIAVARGRQPEDRPNGALDLAEDLGLVGLDDLTAENLVRAMSAMRMTVAASSCARALATMRTFCRWLVRRGHLTSNPADDDALVIPARDRDALGFHAFTAEEVEAMVAAAAAPLANVRSAWPRRDVAALRVLEGCGVRIAELCGLEVRDVDVDFDRPQLRVVRGAKGSKRRTVPVPRRTLEAVQDYLADRRQLAEQDGRLAFSDRSPLWVRNDGAPVNTQFFDRVVRRCAEAGGVSLPGDAAAHGFRHHLGVQLALRGVPVPVISEVLGHANPRTTAIYTRAVGRHLTDALDDAGWL